MTRKRVAVFGASGFVGSAVVEELRAQGHEVVPIRTPRFASVGARDVASTVLEAPLNEQILSTLTGADAVINAAGDSQATGGDEGSLFAANSVVPGVIRRYCTAAEVPRFVHLSSAAVQGRLEPLDDTERYQARSPYARSKMLGERVVLAQHKSGTVVYRPPGVHSSGRQTTESLRRVARSRLSSVPAGAGRPSPQASLDSVAVAIAYLATAEESLPEIVHHPFEGITTASLLRGLGDKEPKRLPLFLCKTLIECAYKLGSLSPRLNPIARRLDILWLGQEQAPSLTLRRRELHAAAHRGWNQLFGMKRSVQAGRIPESRGRLLVVSQYYPPERVWFASSVAESLAGIWRVLSITGYPNYPYGKVFEGYRQRWHGREVVNNVRVIRVPLVTDHSDNAIRRMVSYLSFGLSVAKEARTAASASVAYVYATQMTAAIGPWLWNRLFGVPYVLHIQDLWPDSITGSSIVGDSKARWAIERILTPMLREAYSRAAGIIAIAPTMKAILNQRGVDSDKIEVIYNWDPTRKSDLPQEAKAPKTLRPLRLLYAGNVGEMQDVETLVKAVSHFRPSEVLLTVVGDGTRVEAVRELCKELGSRNVDLLPSVPPEEVSKLYDGQHFVLVTLRNLPAFEGTIPSKLQGAAAHGLPVICSVRGDTSHLVEEYGAGITVDPEDELGLKDAISDLVSLGRDEYERMREGAKLMFRENFTRERAMKQIDAILRRAANEGADI